MGKQKRARQKFHAAAAKLAATVTKPDASISSDTTPLIPTSSTENIFSGININFDSLKKNLSDDTQSVRSYKSLKSECGPTKTLPKKDKLKLRREILLKKIDTVNQMKKQLKIRNKRKNTQLIGDTNPLHDALPSLESLLKSKTSNKREKLSIIKKKCVEKASKRRKELINGVKTFKQALKNKRFKTNPLQAVTEHIQYIVQSEAKINKK